MAFSPSTLYYTAALLHGLSVPGHMLFGVEYVYKAIEKIPSTQNLAVGKSGARNCWDCLNGSLAILALLNYQWARSGGPATTEEKAMAWISLIAGGWAGMGYWKVGNMIPLGCLWVAPTCSVVASLMQSV